jgi:hypothetical protein
MSRATATSEATPAATETHGWQTLPIGNIPVRVVSQTVRIDQLKLDPDNPRIRYLITELPHKPTRQELLALVEKEDFAEELLKQVRDNGGVMDPIHVLHDGTVVEGNTRLACLNRLSRSHPDDRRWQTIPVLRLPEDIAPHLVSILQGNFHVQPKNKWKAYVKAQHLHKMHTANAMSFEAIGKSLGMQKRVVERLVKQYEFMTEKILPRIKGGVRKGVHFWSHVDEFFKRADLEEFRTEVVNIDLFGDLVVSGKLKGGADVRKLSKVLARPRAKEALKKEGVEAAVAIARKSDPTIDSQAFRRVSEATAALKELAGTDLDRLRTEASAQALVRDLYSTIRQAASIAKFRLE